MAQEGANGRKVLSCELPAHAQQRCQKELTLMPVRVAGHAAITESNFQGPPRNAAELNGFVADTTETLDPTQCLHECLGGSRHVIEQSDPPEIERLRQLEPQAGPVEHVRDRLHECYLHGGSDPCDAALVSRVNPNSL